MRSLLCECEEWKEAKPGSVRTYPRSRPTVPIGSVRRWRPPTLDRTYPVGSVDAGGPESSPLAASVEGDGRDGTRLLEG